MTERESVERDIREVLDTESHAIPLSNKLLAPEGLFSRLASTEEERRALVQTPLFKEAQRRFMALQREEAQTFAKIAEQVEAVMPHGGYVLKLESVEPTGGPNRRPGAASERERPEAVRPGTPDGSGQS